MREIVYSIPIFNQGIGIFDLSKYLEISGIRAIKSKHKPLHVVATHTHFDHSGKNELDI